MIAPKDMMTVMRLVAKEQMKRPRTAIIPPVNIVTLCPHLWIIKLATGPEIGIFVDVLDLNRHQFLRYVHEPVTLYSQNRKEKGKYSEL